MTCCNQGPKHKFLHRPRPTPNLSGREKTAASEITPKKWTRISGRSRDALCLKAAIRNP